MQQLGCCSDADCPNPNPRLPRGTCVDSWPCYGGPPVPIQGCRTDSCKVDADCAGGHGCASGAGTGGCAGCVPRHCAAAADCTASSGGVCALFYNAPRFSNCATPMGFYCSYDSSACVPGVAQCPYSSPMAQ